MGFRIDKEIFEKFPGLNIGVVIAKGLDNEGSSEEIQGQIAERAEEIRKVLDKEGLSQNPKILAWRQAYSAFGGKPKKNRSSIENLCRLVLSGETPRQINKLVDIYNLISLKHLLPVGGEDLAKVEGNISLAFAGQDEPEVLLLGEKEPRPPKQGEVIYKDNVSAICRRWNWREADRTKLSEQTKDCILVLEGLPPTAGKEVEVATNELNELVQKHCGATTSTAILNSEKQEIEF